ncbi:MAG: glycosyl hydrolase 115 family protein [Lachnospiraceae bacterium]|nr:glycosyl hydrolase 115 family protein [Lachnospiraceae bacterium]MBQ3906328.1 glycosyl hydrolase 115 family protein [Lachnospiraceae bacterium]
MSRSFVIANEEHITSFVLESTAFQGVHMIADKVAKDIKAVCGSVPQILTKDLTKEETAEGAMKVLENFADQAVIFVGTIGNSEMLDVLGDFGVLDLSQIRGKREVYSISFVGESLVIAGSDKLGTIYGLFAISEYIGVSPMVKFGDAIPQRKKTLIAEADIEIVSKEPSVKYRGFFINDEWPCFGNWAMSHFGGVNAKLYDQVFEFLLRMKGNYLWPAMWASSFPLDGPDGANEELADTYGITIGYSHHEPCLRASEEWDKVRGPESRYGNEWNFHTNQEGLLNYWMDSLKRSGKYNHLITIGMRGERDSSMLGPDATLKENIDLLKSVIKAQRGLIMHYVNFDLDKVPQLLALYKEVEAYFYGDEETEGLKDWEELENVIFMLCEDNYGHMRTLPTADIRGHKGGFGMYYHLDYHGGPVSYEWQASTPLSLIWEQMTEAYEYGVKDVWIVNVGDIKGNEVALNYFLDLAYDFDKWGSSAVNSWGTWLKQWSKKVFPGASEVLQQALADVYEGFVQLNFMRRPEALSAGVYHPCNFEETTRMLEVISKLEKLSDVTFDSLDRISKLPAYSMICYPAKISMNLIKMQLYAGKNQYYAMQGRPAANLYGELMKQCIEEDKRLCDEFREFRNGKWAGMELEKHIGFTKWNDDGWKYPVRSVVEPVTTARMSVSRADGPWLATKNYGAPQVIRVHDFLNPDRDQVAIEVSNDGVGSLKFKIEAEDGEIPSWLKLSTTEGETELLLRVMLTCDRDELEKAIEASRQEDGTYKDGGIQSVRLRVTADDAVVAIDVKAFNPKFENLAPMTFVTDAEDDMIVMEANHFAEKKDVNGVGFVCLEGHGRSGNGMKVLPSTAEFSPKGDKPELIYRFVLPEAGKYRVELWTSPVNSLVNNRALRVHLENGSQSKNVNILNPSYRGGDYNDPKWSAAVMNQIHVVGTEMNFEEGEQFLSIGALEAGVVLERILIYPANKKMKESYLGPLESFYKK